MNVKIKKLKDNAVIPVKAHPTDAGFDLTATSYQYDAVNDWHLYGTGLAFEIPEGHVGLLCARSSNRKTDCYLCNHIGILDSCYRGEVMFTFKNRTSVHVQNFARMNGDSEVISNKPYDVGDRLGQLIIIPYPEITFVEVDQLADSDRGINGHGSSGK